MAELCNAHSSTGLHDQSKERSRRKVMGIFGVPVQFY